MAAAASTVPAVKNAVLAAIQARTLLVTDGVLVARGLPSSLPDQNERIYILNARNVEREWASLGAYKLNETYTLDILVESFGYGDDQDTAEDRLWQLVAEVEFAIRNDLDLGGLIIVARPATVTEDTLPTDEGWYAKATAGIDIEARI